MSDFHAAVTDLLSEDFRSGSDVPDALITGWVMIAVAVGSDGNYYSCAYWPPHVPAWHRSGMARELQLLTDRDIMPKPL